MDQTKEISKMLGSLGEITDEKLDGDQVKNLLGSLQGALNEVIDSELVTICFQKKISTDQLKIIFEEVIGIPVGSIWSDDQLFEEEDEADDDLFLSIDYIEGNYQTVVEVDLDQSDLKTLGEQLVSKAGCGVGIIHPGGELIFDL